MSKQIDLNKLENKLREKIKGMRYFLIPFEYFKEEITNTIREFDEEADCYYFINYGNTIVEDEEKDYIIRYEIAIDELSCDISIGEIVGEIKTKRLIYKEDDIDPHVKIDILDVLDIRLDLEYEDEEDENYIEDENFEDEDYYDEYKDEESDYDVEEIDDDP